MYWAHADRLSMVTDAMGAAALSRVSAHADAAAGPRTKGPDDVNRAVEQPGWAVCSHRHPGRGATSMLLRMTAKAQLRRVAAWQETVERPRGVRGRPRHRPGRLFADCGYDYDKYRRLLRARGITPKFARKGTTHGSGLGKTRCVVERTFAWLHQFKRLRIRYEIRADLHLGLLQPACRIICLRRLRTSF